jgi:hypothetical protein
MEEAGAEEACWPTAAAPPPPQAAAAKGTTAAEEELEEAIAWQWQQFLPG